MTPKVSVYITVHNYGKFVRRAIQSVLNQHYEDWELVIIDDASTDNTAAVLTEYKHHQKIRLIFQTDNRGLAKTANRAIHACRGTYIIRLDADDFFDPNALLVMANYLDQNPDVGLVYPDYYHVSENGEILEHIRRKNVQTETKILDLPAHGAGTMIRKSCFDALNGYNETIRCQDGYDLWIRFIDRFKVHNINLPLFYYRKHGASLTTNSEKILKTRRYIKQLFFKRVERQSNRHILGIIPVRGTLGKNGQKIALTPIAGLPLIQYSLDAAKDVKEFNKLVVVSEDSEILDYCARQHIDVMLRPKKLSLDHTPVEPTISFVLKQLETQDQFSADIVCLLHANAPLRTADHIREALHTLDIFKTDSVVSVCEDNGFFYQHRAFGLEPLFEKRLLRHEKNMLYRENGSIFVSKRSAITADSFLGQLVSHIVMSKQDSQQIDSAYDFWLTEQLLQKKREEGVVDPTSQAA